MKYNEYGYPVPKETLLNKYGGYVRDLPFGLWKIIAIIVGYPVVLAMEAFCEFVKVAFMCVFFIFFIDDIFRAGPAKLPRR